LSAVTSLAAALSAT